MGDTRTLQLDPLVAGLVARRRELGLTQRRVAADIGSKQSHICEMELGYREPSLRVLRRWADRLGMRIVAVPDERGSEAA